MSSTSTSSVVSSRRSSLMQVDSSSCVFTRRQKNEVEQELQALRNRSFNDVFECDKENYNNKIPTKVLKNASSSSVSEIRKSLLTANQTCSSTKLLQKQHDQIRKELEALGLNSPQEDAPDVVTTTNTSTAPIALNISNLDTIDHIYEGSNKNHEVYKHGRGMYEMTRICRSRWL